MVTIGRIFAELLSSWGGPLRIQATSQPKRSSPKAFHDKPVHAWNWTMEGGAIWWYKYASSPESSRYFDPNPLAFPITWFPPTLMLLCGVARVRIVCVYVDFFYRVCIILDYFIDCFCEE
mmetsp:Transcript_67424/g.99960  ORF Transcript_67424/g.99960 Transcript_67424/m.99960 type:complete len:120 (+) Transcript_67424:653-1012(+)